ncbi:MAG: hypothetical protein HGB18_00770 [Candidatus Moranbacteria bacterium]|nr:hypothetical protein [Candidatus Moranbacteria bacterium]
MKPFRMELGKMDGPKAVAVFGIVVFGLLGVASSLFHAFNHDEFEAIHSAWKILSGERIYVDFLQTHHFLPYYVLAPVIALFGPGIPAVIVARLLSLAATVGIVLLTYRIARSLFDRETALFSVFFLTTSVTFLTKVIEVRPDIPLVLFELISVSLLLSHFRTPSAAKLVGSSAALFAAFLFLQKAVFAAFLIGLLLLYRLWKRKTAWRDILFYAGTFVILLLGFVAYVSSAFGWREYFFSNWQLNTLLLNSFPIYKYLLRSIEQNPLLWILFLFGSVHAVRNRKPDIALFFAAGLLATVFVTRTPFPQYYLAAMPWIAMVAAAALVRSRRLNRRFVAVMLLASLPVAGYFFFDLWEDNRGQLDKVSYVLSVTGPDDLVYDGDAQFNLFRRDVDYFWFSVKPKTGILSSYRLVRPYDYDIYGLIDEKRPKVVSSSFVKVKNPSIAEHYSKSSVFPDLYVRKEE